jgi:hypothetical protein
MAIGAFGSSSAKAQSVMKTDPPWTRSGTSLGMESGTSSMPSKPDDETLTADTLSAEIDPLAKMSGHRIRSGSPNGPQHSCTP